MNKSEKIAERIIAAAYKEGGTLKEKEIGNGFLIKRDHNINSILCEYGEFSKDETTTGLIINYYKLNNKGNELARNGYFSGKEKEKKRAYIRDIVAIITASISLIISIYTCVTK
ncbi:MAG: hypothetical protein EGQ20_07235 [Bacteroides oleiciplenus]|nr:hypothetical protein [Bacteroides oleiciplenus]